MSELKPCPFCGGEARRIDIDATKPSVPDAGASYIACGRCYACSPIMFGEKTGLEESWNRRAISTIGPDAKPQDIHKDALELAKALGRITFTDYCNQEAVAMILARDDAIRQECAERARNAIFDFGIGDKEHNYSPIIRKDLAAQLAERAIMSNDRG